MRARRGEAVHSMFTIDVVFTALSSWLWSVWPGGHVSLVGVLVVRSRQSLRRLGLDDRDDAFNKRGLLSPDSHTMVVGHSSHDKDNRDR